MKINRDLAQVPPHPKFGKLCFYRRNKSPGKNWHVFIFSQNDNENYIVVAIDGKEKETPITKQLTKTKDLFHKHLLKAWDATLSHEKRLIILDTILNTEDHKGYEVLTGKQAYEKYIEFENDSRSPGERLYAHLSGTRASNPDFQVKPYKSLEGLIRQFKKRLTFKINAFQLELLDPTELNEKEIELSLIEDVETEVKNDIEKGVQNKYLKFEPLEPTEKDLAKKFLNCLQERKTQLENIRLLPKFEKPEISLAQLALIFHYKGETITRKNGNDIAKQYGHNSGEKLFQLFTKYQSRVNRIGKESTHKKNLNKLTLFESVISKLSTEAKQKATDEMNTFKALIEREQ